VQEETHLRFILKYPTFPNGLSLASHESVFDNFQFKTETFLQNEKKKTLQHHDKVTVFSVIAFHKFQTCIMLLRCCADYNVFLLKDLQNEELELGYLSLFLETLGFGVTPISTSVSFFDCTPAQHTLKFQYHSFPIQIGVKVDLGSYIGNWRSEWVKSLINLC